MRQFALRALSLSILAAIQTLAAQSIDLMTQNLDIGTSQGYVLAFANTKPKLGVDLTFAEILASDIPRRTNDLAARIAAERPDVIGLQEVGLWRFGLTPETAGFVL